MMPERIPALRIAPIPAGFSLAGFFLAVWLLAFPSYSLEFSDDSGSMAGALDTTLSYGTLWRVQGQDMKHYKGSSTPNHDDVNTNDGNRAYDTGVVSQVFRISADLEVDWEDQYGFFIRGTAFYDTHMMDRHNHWSDANRGRSPDQTNTYPYADDWSNDVLDGQGHDAKIQDAYIYGAWDIGDMPLDVRFGKQVINWGEGIFYRDGINTVNAMDGASFALPGSEVKDLLIPQHALSFRLGVTDNLSMAAYYQFEWESSVTPGRGTFFSTNDLFTDGGTKGYNQIPDAVKPALVAYGNAIGINTHGDYLLVADTSASKDADDNGQWGLNFKYFAEEMNDTEFGFYFVKYNSHNPFIEAELSENAGLKALTAVQRAGLDPTSTLGSTLAGLHVLSNSVNATRVYPEDIHMYGISFNTAVGGTSISGELAYRPDTPMWIDHPNDLIDGIKSNLPGILGSVQTPALGCFDDLSQADSKKQYCLNSGPYKNYEEVKLWTGSLVFIRNFGPLVGLDGLYGILEPAFELIQGLDNYDNYVSTASGPWGKAFEDENPLASDRLDKFSWGYTAVLSGELNDVMAGINLNPVITFRHDVHGNSRLTGNFLEGRKAVTMALNGLYMNTVEAGLAYTTFFGSERTNSLHDRDNVAFNVKYYF